MAQDFLQGSIDFHNNYAFRVTGLIPVVNTVSELSRLVISVALAAINLLRVGFYAIGGLGQLVLGNKATYLTDSLDALLATGYNISMVVYAIFSAIPIAGNLYPWVSFCLDPHRYCH